jgi:hypothetical protein
MHGDNHSGLHLRLHQRWHLRTSALSLSDGPSLPHGQGVTTHRLAHRYDRGPISRPLVPCSRLSSRHTPTSHGNQSCSGTLASRMCQRVHTASRHHQQCCRPWLAQWGCWGGVSLQLLFSSIQRQLVLFDMRSFHCSTRFQHQVFQNRLSSNTSAIAVKRGQGHRKPKKILTQQSTLHTKYHTTT